MTFKSINPATGVELAEFPALSAAEIEASLVRAADAAPRWRFTDVSERLAVVARLGALLDADKERLGRMMTLEMGKPIRAAVEEAAKCARACRFYAEHGAAMIADDVVDDADHRSFVSYEPLGVVLAVMPWNFPFWQVVRFVAPALVAGNVALLKHASTLVSLCRDLIFRLSVGFSWWNRSTANPSRSAHRPARCSRTARARSSVRGVRGPSARSKTCCR